MVEQKPSKLYDEGSTSGPSTEHCEGRAGRRGGARGGPSWSEARAIREASRAGDAGVAQW
jgi:hypothetical protein